MPLCIESSLERAGSPTSLCGRSQVGKKSKSIQFLSYVLDSHRELAAKDTSGTSDPFLEIVLGDKKHTTSVIIITETLLSVFFYLTRRTYVRRRRRERCFRAGTNSSISPSPCLSIRRRNSNSLYGIGIDCAKTISWAR